MNGDETKQPSHYCEGRKYEPRKVAEDWGLIKDAYLYCAFKYIARAGRKPFEGSLEEGMRRDLLKAREYIDFRLEVLAREMESDSDKPELMKIQQEIPEVCEHTRREFERYRYDPPYDTTPRITCEDHVCIVADSNGTRILDDEVKGLVKTYKDTLEALSDNTRDLDKDCMIDWPKGEGDD